MKFIDFFAGIGGFRRGMELAGHICSSQRILLDMKFFIRKAFYGNAIICGTDTQCLRMDVIIGTIRSTKHLKAWSRF